jgi:Tfp pilus assembly protein PilE
VGQQQLLLLIIGAIIVAIMVSVGVAMFGAHSTESNKDAVTSSLQNIAADAYQYKLRPKAYGGGRPSYAGYVIPDKLQRDDNGVYQLNRATDTQLVLQGTSALNTDWTATATADDTGKFTADYSGW